jgi:hypothetical protein
MKVKQTRKVSFRVAPPVKEFLEAAAECSDLTLADFIRDCLNYLLTGEQRRLPLFFREDGLGELWPLDNAMAYKRFMDKISGG